MWTKVEWRLLPDGASFAAVDMLQHMVIFRITIPRHAVLMYAAVAYTIEMNPVDEMIRLLELER